MSPDPIYLDHASTTPLRPEVAAAMAPYISGRRFANPSGSHSLARAARHEIDEARERVGEALGVDAGGIVFTGSGTEAANLALIGSLAGRPRGGDGGIIVCSAIEHACVRETMQAIAAGRSNGLGAMTLREAPVDGDGVVDLEAMESLLDADVVLVSVMLANNEVGSVQPLDHIARLVRQRAPGALLHTDAVQAAVHLDVAEAAAEADLISISAHKLGGPKGTGALAIRTPAPLAPIIHGGGQERDRRSGTHDVAGIVGLATALDALSTTRKSASERIEGLRDRLADGLVEGCGAVESSPRSRTLPGHCHLRFPGTEQEELLMLLDRAGLCASAGAACASGALEASHVLAAMGVPAADACSAIRLSLGYTTTDDDIARALEIVPAAVARLRA